MALLEKGTLKKVRSLAKNHCANYINGGCIFGGSCDYDTKHGGSISCDYFEQSILPMDKGLEKEYKEAHGIGYREDMANAVNFSYKPCSRCGESFKPTSRGAKYCGDFYRIQARKESFRKANKKR